MTRKQANDFIVSLKKIREDASDALASSAINVYPTLKEDGHLVLSGTRIYWNDTIKRAAVDLWDTAENNPDNASTLWEDIAYKNGYRIIPATITAGRAFALGEYGWWNDTLYESLIAANVHTPEQHEAGWKKI